MVIEATPGQLSVAKLGMVDPMGASLAQRALDESDRIRTRMAPPGALNLPALLDARRLEFGITDGAFRQVAIFERVFVFQIPSAANSGETFGDTTILKPETSKKKAMQEAPRGVLVSAGLRALDILRSNGVDLGHVITFIKLARYHIPYETIAGRDYHLIQLNVGDLVGSEDIALAQITGGVKVVTVDNKDAGLQHAMARKIMGGWETLGIPMIPWTQDDL